MFENPGRGRQARNFTTNVPKILDLKSSSEQIFFRKLSLGAPERSCDYHDDVTPEYQSRNQLDHITFLDFLWNLILNPFLRHDQKTKPLTVRTISKSAISYF